MKKKDTVRLKIIEAALEEVCQRGTKFTMEQLAVRAGVSKKTLYNLLGDKEKIMIHSVSYVYRKIEKEQREILEDGEMDIIEQIRKLFAGVIKWNLRFHFQEMLLEEERYPGLCLKIRSVSGQEWKVMEEVMNRAMRQGRMRRVSTGVVRGMLRGMMEYFYQAEELQSDSAYREEKMQEAINIVLDGIRMS